MQSELTNSGEQVTLQVSGQASQVDLFTRSSKLVIKIPKIYNHISVQEFFIACKFITIYNHTFSQVYKIVIDIPNAIYFMIDDSDPFSTLQNLILYLYETGSHVGYLAFLCPFAK